MKAVKKITAAIAAGACLVGMAACGGSSSAGSTDLTYGGIKLGETGKDIKTTISLYTNRTDMLQSNYPGTSWKQYLAAFNKMYPNIKVKITGGTNYADSAATRLQGNSWGDIMMIPDSIDKSDLGTYFLSYGKTDEVGKLVNFASSKAYDDNVYGIASVGNGSGIVYNKKVFKDAGIDKLPTTPKQFIADLKLVKEKTSAIPLYTNYAAGWTMGAWDNYIGSTATGDAKYWNQELAHTKNPFSDPGDGTHAYNVYKILYDAVSEGLTESDYSTTDWESSKTKMNNGQIATMALGSWAVSQMQAAGSHPNDVGYMPFPISVKGKQYSTEGADYSFGINKKTSKDNQKASMIFVKWMTEKSGFSYNEGCLPVAKDITKLPAVYSDFTKNNVKFVIDEPALKGEEDLFSDLNSDSELALASNGNSRVQAIVENASTKKMSYDDMVKQWNSKWNAALKTENVDVKYDTVVK